MIFKRIEALLKSCETDFPLMPPTQLYNEGWMLRLTVDRFASIDLKNEPHPLAVPSECRWYSDALLPSAFIAKSRGDSRAESWTHADGVIGHFDIGNGAKGNMTLLTDAKHFVVLEAKMFSKLSAGVKNATYFNQAARNVACMAEVLKHAGRDRQQNSKHSDFMSWLLGARSKGASLTSTWPKIPYDAWLRRGWRNSEVNRTNGCQSGFFRHTQSSTSRPLVGRTSLPSLPSVIQTPSS